MGSAPHSEPERRADAEAVGTCIDDRYEVRALLGRGGMASVYRVLDRTSDGEIALKQLHVTGNSQQAIVVALFEREFHTLAQLHHPSVITVYDYGFGADGAYYTMELLDGGDLRERAPVPWREACALFFDVCSSLALLHSRRLLHRDVSPRNIRCTLDRHAKLIDFGAMGPMVSGFAQVPPPPSARMPGIPAALDALVLSLLHAEPELRPRSAYEVMQQLAAIAGLDAREADGVSAAYLTAPTLIGREDLLELVQERLADVLRGRGAGLMVRGAPGQGRSRVLDACALSAKTLGVTVLRASAAARSDELAVALALVRHLLQTLPGTALAEHFATLFEPTDGDERTAEHSRTRLRSAQDLARDPEASVKAIARCLRTASRSHPLLLAVDDVQRVDDLSAESSPSSWTRQSTPRCSWCSRSRARRQPPSSRWHSTRSSGAAPRGACDH